MKLTPHTSTGIKLCAVVVVTFAGSWLIAQQFNPIKNISIALDTTEGVSILKGNGELQKILVSTEDTKYFRPTLSGSILSAIVSEECKPNYVCKKNRKIISIDLNSKKIQKREMAFDISFARFSPDQKYLLVGTNNGWNLHVYENEKEIFTLKTISGSSIAIDRAAWISNNEILIEGSYTNKTFHRDFIASVTIDSGEIKIICEGNLVTPFYGNIYRPKWAKDNHGCFEHPEVSALYGSVQWPVEEILDSTDSSGRYYFYVRWSSAFGGFLPEIVRIWVEGYDNVTHQTFKVFTLRSYWEDFQRKWLFREVKLLR